MKRSEIDAHIGAAIELLAAKGSALPPEARWDRAAWCAHAAELGDFAARGIGWDLTDFGSGDFARTGLLLYTLSNGLPDGAGQGGDQAYANKLLVVQPGQVTPTHHHWRKVEDIIVLAGGRLCIRLFAVGPGDAVDRARPVRLLRDNLWTEVGPGDTVTLAPGERVRLERHHYHAFWGEASGGPVIVEEVSSVNDDRTDNCFLPEERRGRFPAIDEDGPARFLLCSDVKKVPGTFFT